VQGKPAMLFPWCEGEHLPSRGVDARHAGALGRALAELHLAGRDLADRRAGIYTATEIARRFAGFAGSSDPALAQAVSILGAEIARLPAERTADLPGGLIHQDLFRDNVLFDPSGRVTALLDFEQAVWGGFAYDLAVCLLAWCFEGTGFDWPLAAALVAGYETVRTLEPRERRALPIEARAAAVRFTVTRITDVYLGPPGAPPGKDFRSYLARLEVLRRGEWAISCA
jgi:homoserine kinase type II